MTMQTAMPERKRKTTTTPTVEEFMTPQPMTIGRDQTLAVAHRMMRENKIRHLPVLEKGDLVGVLSQRDLYFLETIAGVDLDKDKVDDAMTQEAYAVPPEEPIDKVAARMAKAKMGCAVVVEKNRVIGIFTATDALRMVAKGAVPKR